MRSQFSDLMLEILGNNAKSNMDMCIGLDRFWREVSLGWAGIVAQQGVGEEASYRWYSEGVICPDTVCPFR